MTVPASDRASAIFFALAGVPAEERARLLDERCDGDEALRGEVERLLKGLAAPESFVSPLDSGVQARPDGVALAAGTVVGDFVVIRQIGAGGTGVVHLAHQQHPPRVVALKVLRREFVASAVQRRFEIEAELLAHLQHPGIAQVHAAHPGNQTTPPFIAMELVDGPPLTDYADIHQLSVHDRIELLASVCDAVQHAHQRGIIHRDLKPANILVTGDGQPKVLDFGVARRLDVSAATIATEAGQLMGTLAYMSPEQVQALPGTVDTRTDIHALGVILFRLLAGRLPFSHDSPSLPELARRIVQDEPPRLGTLDPSLKGDIEIVAARAMAKEKERRYPSAAGLAADLRRYLAGQPISASADSTWYTLRRQLGRYRLALGTSAAMLAAVGGLAFYASLQRSRADRVNVQLEEQLATSTIERGRLISLSGNHPVAEELVWRELFRRPDSRHARWTLWDIYSRESTPWTRIEHETGTQTIRFSPDNRLLLTAGRLDGELHLIDLASGQTIRRFQAPDSKGTLRAFFTQGGGTIVAAGQDGSIRQWEAATGAPKGAAIPVAGLRDFAVAGHGEAALVAVNGGVEVWSLTTGQRLSRLAGLAPAATVVTVDRGGALAVIGSPDGTVTAVDLARRTKLWQARGDGAVLSVGVSPDGGHVVSGDIDGHVYLWSAATGARVRNFPSENGRVRNFAFDDAGGKLAVAAQWTTRLWDLADASAPPRSLGGSEGVTDVHLRPDGRELATCNGGSGQVRLWDLVADSRLDAWSDHRGSVTGLAVDRATGSIVSGAIDGAVAIRQPGQARVTLLPAGASVNALDVSRDGRWLITAGSSASTAVWDLREARRVVDLSGAGSSRAAAFTGEGRRIVIGHRDGTMATWDWSPGAATNLATARIADAEILAVVAHGRYVFVADANRNVSVRDAVTGQEVRRIRTSSAPFALALTRDGSVIAAGTYLGVVELWDVESGAKRAELKGQTAVVTSVDISPDGTLLAASSRDGSTRLWDLTGQFLAAAAVRKVGAIRVRFLEDGRRLAIGYADGEVEVRDLTYFFRYAAGHAAYHLRLLRGAGEVFPRADEVIRWSQETLKRR